MRDEERAKRFVPCIMEPVPTSLSTSSLVFMLTHIVIWKYMEDVPQSEREEHIASLRRLPSLIPEIETFAVGFDVLRLERSFDTGLVATFRNRQALAVYTEHPEHLKVAAFGRNISAKVASVDFEDES